MERVAHLTRSCHQDYGTENRLPCRGIVRSNSIQLGHEVVKVSATNNDDSVEIDEMIQELGDWRGPKLSRLRSLIKKAVPGVTEELKWRKPSNPHGVPTWSQDGPICTGETYKTVVKLTFFKGASLADPTGLFNSSLEGNTRRAIDFGEADEIDELALEALLREATALNTGSAAPRRKR